MGGLGWLIARSIGSLASADAFRRNMFRFEVVSPTGSLASADVVRREWIHWMIVSPMKSFASVAVLRREMIRWSVGSPTNDFCFTQHPFVANDSVGNDVSPARWFASATSCVEMVMLSKNTPQKLSCCRRCCRDRSSPCPPCSPCSKCLLPHPGCDMLRLVVGGGSFCDSNAREQFVGRKRPAAFVLNG